MIFCLASCDNSNTNKDNTSTIDEYLDKYLEDTSKMDEADFITFAEDYANSAKPVYILKDVIDSKIDSISSANYDTIRQSEWVNIIFNIAKYQDLLSVYSYGISFNDDDTIDYEKTIETIGDGVFEQIYESLEKNGLRLTKRNDELYVTTDVLAFIERAGDIQEAFKKYLEIVNEIDTHNFLKNSVINYDNIVHCLVFCDDFMKNQTGDKIWETVYQQYYYQVMMYVGLYGYGGCINEDNSWNVDFEEMANNHIAENPDTIFASIMTKVLEKAKEASESEDFNLDKVQEITDSTFEETTRDLFYEFYKTVYPAQYAQMMAAQENSGENILADGESIEEGEASIESILDEEQQEILEGATPQ